MSIVDYQSDSAPPTAERAGPPATVGITLQVTPQGAFATGALFVSALALAFALGRALPDRAAPAPTPADGPQTIEQVRHARPILYHELQIDSGEAG